MTLLYSDYRMLKSGTTSKRKKVEQKVQQKVQQEILGIVGIPKTLHQKQNLNSRKKKYFQNKNKSSTKKGTTKNNTTRNVRVSTFGNVKAMRTTIKKKPFFLNSRESVSNNERKRRGKNATRNVRVSRFGNVKAGLSATIKKKQWFFKNEKKLSPLKEQKTPSSNSLSSWESVESVSDSDSIETFNDDLSDEWKSGNNEVDNHDDKLIQIPENLLSATLNEKYLMVVQNQNQNKFILTEKKSFENKSNTFTVCEKNGNEQIILLKIDKGIYVDLHELKKYIEIFDKNPKYVQDNKYFNETQVILLHDHIPMDNLTIKNSFDNIGQCNKTNGNFYQMRILTKYEFISTN